MTEDETLKVIRTEARKDAYFWLVMVVTVVFASAGSILVSVGVSHRVNQRLLERERAAREATERAFCGIIVLLDDSYKKVKPIQPGGIALAKAISLARTANHCPPYQGD